MSLPIIGGFIVILAVGFVIGYFFSKLIAERRRNSAESRVQKLLDDSRQEAKEILIEAKNKAVKVIEEAQGELKERDREVKRSEERIRERESFADKRLAQFDEREKELADRIEKVKEIKATVESAKAAIDKEFERVSGMSATEARDILMKRVEKEAEEDLAARIRKLETTGIEELERKAKSILATIIQRVATATTSEVTTTTVGIPSDDVKGKIIGREGRNIRALERAAGVEIVVDDTPGAIVISGFDPVRRHIAKMALENLIADGRIQPARIEETVDKARAEIEKQIKEAAKNAAFEIGVFDLDERLLSLLGRLKFRTSYGQNVLQHSIEMSHMAGMLAEELGGDVAIAKKGALLHDIGKAVDHEVQGTHVEIGRRILQKFGADNRIIQAMQSHHEEYPYETLESVIVQTVDAVSASRPGARRDSVENYLKRLGDLEAIANSFDGVEKSYAIQAGREIRIFVTPEKVSDVEARTMAKAIATRIENELKYPGEIKVNVIRENRVVEFAR
ncbi:MAG: ribonuclease Y [Candidatus Sungbacteria bacterium RIFCSPLOWO2_01_FULL_59_16]|uniref:Ribonuclease Y n=1 Tax=Candidatus Sungbacteria bacterium RIFCSPLOWO2_01_FULL_59_16 TaxID=1802280 RepID=A0A1G2LAI3_9BACT|nr:MAG: ribonuclease Y [Candidatus Sungbacteria bacterium RIFCSPLOWO2_01_FULL_59_16]